MEELRTQILLERRDLPAERRLREVQLLGRLGEVAEARDLHEAAELLEIHSHSLSAS
jgi:hypothetical protein